MYTNQQIETVKKTGEGQWANGVFFSTLDGLDVRLWLESQGYTVIKNFDTGRNGIAITLCGVKVSTNGWISRAQLITG